MSKKIKQKFSFLNPAVYKIEVAGDISTSWTEKLGGMQITVQRNKDQEPVSILIGQMNDQSALSGVLSTLYDNHLTIISVKTLDEING